jgi:thiol-disulfide isomerase/thioredoxin
MSIFLFYSNYCTHSRHTLESFKLFKKSYEKKIKVIAANIHGGFPSNITKTPTLVIKNSFSQYEFVGRLNLKQMEKIFNHYYTKKNRIRSFIYLKNINQLTYQLQKYICKTYFH